MMNVVFEESEVCVKELKSGKMYTAEEVIQIIKEQAALNTIKVNKTVDNSNLQAEDYECQAKKAKRKEKEDKKKQREVEEEQKQKKKEKKKKNKEREKLLAELADISSEDECEKEAKAIDIEYNMEKEVCLLDCADKQFYDMEMEEFCTSSKHRELREKYRLLFNNGNTLNKSMYGNIESIKDINERITKCLSIDAHNYSMKKMKEICYSKKDSFCDDMESVSSTEELKLVKDRKIREFTNKIGLEVDGLITDLQISEVMVEKKRAQEAEEKRIREYNERRAREAEAYKKLMKEQLEKEKIDWFYLHFANLFGRLNIELEKNGIKETYPTNRGTADKLTKELMSVLINHIKDDKINEVMDSMCPPEKDVILQRYKMIMNRCQKTGGIYSDKFEKIVKLPQLSFIPQEEDKSDEETEITPGEEIDDKNLRHDVRCSFINRDNIECDRPIIKDEYYCYVHRNCKDKVRVNTCRYINEGKDGELLCCSKKVDEGQNLCSIHLNKKQSNGMCKGKKERTGEPCSFKAKDGSEYCGKHSVTKKSRETKICCGITKSMDRCDKKAREGEEYCGRHMKQKE